MEPRYERRGNKVTMEKRGLTEKIKQLPMSKKLTFSHGIIIVSTFIFIVILLIGMKSVESYVRSMLDGPTTNAFYMGDIRYGLTDIQRALNYVVAEGESELETTLPKMKTDMQTNVDMIQNAYDILKETLLTEENKALLQEIYDMLLDSTAHREKIVSLLEQGKLQEAMQYNNDSYKPRVDEMKKVADKLDQSIIKAGEDYCDTASNSVIIMVVAGIIVLILITSIAIYVTRMVTKMITEPVAQLTEAAHCMYNGELAGSKVITYQSNDELGQLSESMRGTMDTLSGYVNEISDRLKEIAKGDLTMSFHNITNFRGDFASIKESLVFILKSFNETLTQIHETSAQVDVGSDEIAKAAADLSEGTGEQASAVEELTAAVQSVAMMAETSAKQTEEAYESVQVSVKNAQNEKRQMEELEKEMLHIKEISSEIEDIIASIEDIASQTNLLSLNASIEAARAGEAGRGFAVVADQIGKLASDSAQAAVTTKELIEKTIQEIDKGNKITASTAKAFVGIIEGMQEIANVARSTTETAQAQAQALKQVEDGIEQISMVTQQNAAASEESSAISEQLAGKAVELDKLVNRFKLYNK